MPFKAGKSPMDISKKYKSRIEKLASENVKSTLTKVVVYAAGASKEIAPIEFGALVNSQFREVTKIADGYRGTVGYTVNYALPLEDPKRGSRLDGWQPRPPDKKQGPAWNPRASQGFLSQAFTGREESETIRKIVIDGLRIR